MVFLYSLVALCSMLLAGNAASAEEAGRPRLPLFALPQPASAWSGLYVGLNAGISPAAKQDVSAFSRSAAPQFPIVPAGSFALPPVGATRTQKASLGFSAGAQVGYNHKVNEHLILGVEADIQRTGAGF